MMPKNKDLPGVRFGKTEAKSVDWRKGAKQIDDRDDDEELKHTPEDVVAMLGFDPAKETGK